MLPSKTEEIYIIHVFYVYYQLSHHLQFRLRCVASTRIKRILTNKFNEQTIFYRSIEIQQQEKTHLIRSFNSFCLIFFLSE